MDSDKVRRRKLEKKNGTHKEKKPKKSGKKSRTSSIQRQLICLIISASLLTLFFSVYLETFPWHDVSHTTIDKIAIRLGYHNPVHAVIIDAGSTGSRVLAFTFHKAYLDDRLILDKELFVQIEPGLSAFANEPAKGAASISELLERAKKEIPEQYWESTPLVLKATAGLRLLPESKSEAILEEVKALFKNCPFHTNDDSVTIMDGVDEGIFSWFTVNFLYDRISKGPDQTVAALDLGGGSTQVTFAINGASTVEQKKFIHVVPSFHKNVTVYTHSYLGLGLMAARKAIFKVGYPKGSINYMSECVNPIVTNASWYYGGKNYSISGPKTNILYKDIPSNGVEIEDKVPIVKFDVCLKIVKQHVKQLVNKPEELGSKEINAFSYYFDRASEFGLIDPYKGGVVKVKDFMKAAREACETANVDQPFMCLDLTFISAILKDGFGLKPDTSVKLFKKINGHEISWALGAAFNILQ